uniref:SAM domain-containing protein n=1 Tax=Neogobius melanostomus TaxID=47308 RepID=A0A8C6SLZ4_9GOBI
MASNVIDLQAVSTRTADFYYLQWSCQDVGSWIEDLGFPQYKACFIENFITGRKLVHVNHKNLPKLGITDFEHIKVIVGRVRELLEITESPWDTRVMFLQKKSRTGAQADGLTYEEFISSLYHSEDR